MDSIAKFNLVYFVLLLQLICGVLAGDVIPNNFETQQITIKDISNPKSPPAPLFFPTDKNIPEISTIKLPPEVFPEDPEKFKIVPPCNDTALKILQKVMPTTVAATKSPKDDVENFQKSHEKSDSPIELEEQFNRHKGHIQQSNFFNFEDDTVVDHPGLRPGHIMAIVACVMAALCISAYVGLLSWKHYLERRYGARERLVNEDDFTVIVSRNRPFDL